MWKPIDNFPWYEINELGVVRVPERIDCLGRRRKLKYLQPVLSNGYPVVTLFNEEERKLVKIHRLVAIAFIPNPKNLPCVNHIDGGRKNYQIENLEWCDYKHNTNHSINIGLDKRRGETSSTAKLTWEKVGEIRSLSGLLNNEELAKMFNVGTSTISRVRHKKVFKPEWKITK